MMATFVGLGSINTSCSRDNEPVASDGDQKAPISFNVNIGTLPAPTVTTRGELDNKTTGAGYYFNENDKICIAIKGVSGSSRDKTTEDVKTYKVLAANAGSTHAAPAKTTLTYDGTATDGFLWLSTSEKIALRAWSNGTTTAATDPLAKDASSVTIPYELEKDQATNGYKELLYYSNSSIDYNASGIDIPLYHQLSRIVATIEVEDATAGAPSVTIGHNSDGNRVPVKGTFAESSTNYGSWTVSAYATATAAHWGVVTPRIESTTPKTVYSAVIIPGTAADIYKADLRFFNITLGTKTFAYKLPTGGQTFEAGKQYNYTITVGNQGITVTSNITDWTDAVDGTNFTHGDGLAVLKNVKMSPLWYVATGNMTGATTMGTGISSSLFSWGDAMSYFSSDGASKTAYYNGNKTITGQEGSTWHLPVLGEWWSIVPLEGLYADGVTVLNLDGPMTSAKPVIFGYNAETKAGFTDYSYWKNISAKEVHAIRFLGTDYCSAWKYKLFGSGTSTDPYYVVVSTILIDYVTIADASTWYTNNFASLTFSGNLAVERSFYPTGLKFGTDPISQNYQFGYHWSATQSESNSDWIYVEGFGGISTTYYGGRIDPTNADKNTLNYGVRLFRDN